VRKRSHERTKAIGRRSGGITVRANGSAEMVT
jgi:hypothetical protein